jgi:hypothetical protein
MKSIGNTHNQFLKLVQLIFLHVVLLFCRCSPHELMERFSFCIGCIWLSAVTLLELDSRPTRRPASELQRWFVARLQEPLLLDVFRPSIFVSLFLASHFSSLTGICLWCCLLTCYAFAGSGRPWRVCTPGWPSAFPRRILLLGAPASGKSELGKQLAALANIPLVSTDLFRWMDRKGGNERPDFLPVVLHLCSTDAFILEGNWRRIQSVIGPRIQVDTIIYLSTPKFIVYSRLICRDLWRWLRCQGGASEFLFLFNQSQFHPSLEPSLREKWRANDIYWEG